MKVERVSFTQEEAQWFARNVVRAKRLLEVSSRKDKGVLERTTYKSLAAMARKAEAVATTETEIVDVLLPRKQKIVLRDLIGSVLKTLITHVIPEYERRTTEASDADAVLDYPGYLEKAKSKAIRLEKMARKLK